MGLLCFSKSFLKHISNNLRMLLALSEGILGITQKISHRLEQKLHHLGEAHVKACFREKIESFNIKTLAFKTLHRCKSKIDD